MATDYSKTIWDYLVKKLGNEYGAAGLMGNLQAESDLCPFRVQGDLSADYAVSAAYTAQVDSGAISKEDFMHNGPGGGGYGLAQWTFYTRKQALYEMKVSGGYPSIGNINLALDYLWWELNTSYYNVLAVLYTARTVRQASDIVLHQFENPADQSEAVELTREALGQAWYDKYSGSSPSPTPTKKNEMPLLLKYIATRRRV